METLMEEFKPVALEQFKFKIRPNNIINRTLVFLADQDSNQRNKTRACSTSE